MEGQATRGEGGDGIGRVALPFAAQDLRRTQRSNEDAGGGTSSNKRVGIWSIYGPHWLVDNKDGIQLICCGLSELISPRITSKNGEFSSRSWEFRKRNETYMEM